MGILTLPFHAFKCLVKQNTLLAVSLDQLLQASFVIEILAVFYGCTFEHLH